MTIPPKHTIGPDELSFVAASRAGERDVAERSFRDFSVNGSALRTMLDLGDVAPVFGWLDRRTERGYARKLVPAAKGSSRATLYICPQCADLGCGYVSVRVEAIDDCVVWSEPLWEDGALQPRDPWARADPDLPKASIPPLVRAWRDLWFDKVAYRTALALYI